MAETHLREGPNVLAIGLLVLLGGLVGASATVDGPSTIVLLFVAGLFLALLLMVHVGWGDRRAPPKLARAEPTEPPAVARGRVVPAPGPRRTPTV